ncbi:MAG: 16S rRNA (guanine(966)-N(2))-methyltransferase RsmD [Polyangiales bacterium]
MRIIGGVLRGRRLPARPAPSTRPTSDRVREGIASALEARGAFAGASVLDLFAGTGALGLEALSRGAASVVAVDDDRTALRSIADNARALGVAERLQALPLDLHGAAGSIAARMSKTGRAPFGLVFADPPYTLVQVAADLIADLNGLSAFAPGALVVLEHATREPPSPHAGLRELASYRYGDSSVALWQAIAPAVET